MCTTDTLKWKLHSKTGAGIIKKMKKDFSTYGIANTLLNDNRPPFNSAEFENFVRLSGAKHVTSSPGYPQSNGWGKCSHTVKNFIKKAKGSETD